MDLTVTSRRASRFWARVDVSSECWIWQGFVDARTGYGRVSLNNRPIGAHQLAFLIANGWVPQGRQM